MDESKVAVVATIDRKQVSKAIAIDLLYIWVNEKFVRTDGEVIRSREVRPALQATEESSLQVRVNGPFTTDIEQESATLELTEAVIEDHEVNREIRYVDLSEISFSKIMQRRLWDFFWDRGAIFKGFGKKHIQCKI